LPQPLYSSPVFLLPPHPGLLPQRGRRKQEARGREGNETEGKRRQGRGRESPFFPSGKAPRVKASLPRGERKSKVFRFKLVSPAVRTLNSSRFLKNLFSGRAVFSSDLAERAFPSSPLSPRGRGLG